MRALTLHRPWAWAITDAGKHIENRTWSSPSIIGERLAVHAGLTVGDESVFDFIEQAGGKRPPADGGPQGIVAVARVDEMLFSSRSRWFIGPVGWKLSDVQPLAEPVPCRGALGLWTLPPDVEALVLEQLGRPRHRRSR